MTKQKVCVSFDYDEDRSYYYMLEAWDKNENFEFSFSDCTPSEIQSESISRIKAVLTSKIDEATTMLVIIGRDANKRHTDSNKIGYKNWQNYEIAKAKELGKRLVAVKLDRENESPEELLGAGASWAMSFTEDAINAALREA